MRSDVRVMKVPQSLFSLYKNTNVSIRGLLAIDLSERQDFAICTNRLVSIGLHNSKIMTVI